MFEGVVTIRAVHSFLVIALQLRLYRLEIRDSNSNVLKLCSSNLGSQIRWGNLAD